MGERSQKKSQGLNAYREKRDFRKTPEPEGKPQVSAGRRFVVQKHAARRLHYDLRLELNGTLKSWAVPKGPSPDPGQKRLAVEVEDHPLAYGSFEGTIPPDEYGGGTVMVWDSGRWEPVSDPEKGMREGNLKFRLHGLRLHGEWVLARMSPKPGDKGPNWLLIKKKDEFGQPGSDDRILDEHNTSALTNRTMAEIADGADAKAAGAQPSRAGGRADPGAIDPSRMTHARSRGRPARIAAQLATLADRPPAGDAWLSEIKFDGYRGIAYMDEAGVRIYSRNGKDWTDRFREIAHEIGSLPVDSAVLDGEIVALNPDGTPSFQTLQNMLKGIEDAVLAYYVFDLPFCQGFDLTRTPLQERKALLAELLATRSDWTYLRFSDHVAGSAAAFHRQACRHALEGIVAKRADSAYEQKRTRSWLKVKCLLKQEFVIGGFTEPSGTRSGFGALLLGYHDARGRLIYAGRVGTGFNEQILHDLKQRLLPQRRSTPAFSNPPTGREARGVHWTRPELVAEVAFGSWTNDNILRHASFKGLREDKAARDIVRETPQAPPARPASAEDDRSGTARPQKERVKMDDSDTNTVAGVPLSNPDKTLFDDPGVSKMELARYYEEISEAILPHIIGRPLSLVRCPRGSAEKCFYQKHATDSLPPSIKDIPIKEKEKRKSYIYIEDLSGLIALVQLGVLEIHPWGCRVDRIERPDRITFDLDPGPGVRWDAVVQAARLLHDFMQELGLQSFVKTSGGKGLHVVVPLTRRNGWDEIRTFSENVTRAVAGHFPDRYVATMSKSKRQGKIFIDYFRNSRGSTTVAAYSTRTRAGATVSAPVSWKELENGVAADAYDIRNLPGRIRRLKDDPWQGFFEIRQSLTRDIQSRAASLPSRMR